MYTKLFQSIVTSTIWNEDDRTRIVWITLLALADRHGEIAASIPGLARVAGVPVSDCEAAIAKFLNPDPYSRTPDYDGRRIEQIPGGWVVLNHAKYRLAGSKDDQRAKAADRQKRFRERSRNDGVTLRNAPVTHGRDIAEAEAEAEAESEAVASSSTGAAREVFPDSESETLAKQGKSLESLSARLALPVASFIDHGASLGITEAKVRQWADSRVANGWTTAKGKSLTPVTWPADMNGFAAASQEISSKQNNGKDNRPTSRNDNTANAGRAAAFAGIGRLRPGVSDKPSS